MDGQTRVNKSTSPQLSGAQNQFPTEWQSFYNNAEAEQAPHQVSPPQEAYLDVEPSQEGSLTKATEPPSSPPTTQHTVIGSPGLESVVSTGDKEVYNGVGYHSAHPPAVPPRKRICGLPKKWFLVAAGLATCVMMTIAIALGVVFGTRKSSSNNPTSRPKDTAPPGPIATGPSPNSGDPDFSIGGALNTQYYSTAGAFNGTGLALASQSFDQDDRGEIVMYFQHWSGDLRWSQLMSDGSWQGGSASETLAQDAKNGTPISAVAYSVDKESIWHIFYIDLNNTVRERINSNTTNVWREGPLSKRNLKANRADQVGIQACWFGNFYGDSSFKKSDAFNAPNTDGLPNDQVGMRLWYASSNTTFEQLGWLHGEDDWIPQDTWQNKNGRAGVGCYSWGPGSVTYVFMVDLDNTLEIWWRDTNTSLPGNFSHPINDWTNTSISIPNLHPSTSLGYTNYLYVQSSDHTIHGYNISWHSENTSFVSRDDFTIRTAGNGSLGVPGTHLSVTTLPNQSGGNDLFAFYQTEGDDVSVFSRDMLAGPWAGTKVPIPNV